VWVAEGAGRLVTAMGHAGDVPLPGVDEMGWIEFRLVLPEDADIAENAAENDDDEDDDEDVRLAKAAAAGAKEEEAAASAAAVAARARVADAAAVARTALAAALAAAAAAVAAADRQLCVAKGGVMRRAAYARLDHARDAIAAALANARDERLEANRVIAAAAERLSLADATDAQLAGERAAFTRLVRETHAKSSKVDKDRAAADVQSQAARRDLLAGLPLFTTSFCSRNTSS
jgi:hypothetical protein